MVTKQTGRGIADLLQEKRGEILRLAEKHGALNVRVFGSVARGEASDDSDIDLLVTWNYGHLSRWGGIGLPIELTELLGRNVDVVGEDELHRIIRERVLREAVPL
ncbi:MAG: nucleotidyltransferase family protein [Chloroflexaceae bacterium]|nr:nucleotidyltransferase family protein [Chloroflexaceae bacterium]